MSVCCSQVGWLLSESMVLLDNFQLCRQFSIFLFLPGGSLCSTGMPWPVRWMWDWNAVLKHRDTCTGRSCHNPLCGVQVPFSVVGIAALTAFMFLFGVHFHKVLFHEKTLRIWSVRASRASFNRTTVEFWHSFQIFLVVGFTTPS